MAVATEVTIPYAKPAFELIDDRLCQKVSPQYDHARLQFVLATRLTAWAEGRGRVGIEWRFTFDLPDGRQNSLVPDVAYLSFDRIPRDRRAEAQQPRVAPEIAVEILSPDDWRGHVERKRELYLDAGTQLVIEIDPRRREVTVHALAGSSTLAGTDVLQHPAMPGFRLALPDLFAALDD